MSTYFENLRELVPIRVSTGQAIHAIVDPKSRRVAAFTNFALTPRVVRDNLPAFEFEIHYNIQKILLTSGGEMFRPRIKSRENSPWAFGVADGSVYDAEGVPLAQDLMDKYELVAAQSASVDFLIKVINTKRREYNNISIFRQDSVYGQKTKEAIRVRADYNHDRKTPLEFVPFISAYADLVGLTLIQAADKIFEKSISDRYHLVDTETERMKMTRSIFACTSYEELKQLMHEYATDNEGIF
jgi:ABC-type thiamine transport system substrate-binding protein